MTELQTKLSVVIVNYNASGLLKRCLSNMLELGLDFPLEMIVVDNHSQDDSYEWLRQIASPKLEGIFLSENRGFAAGCNAGISRANGEYILLLNTDAFPTRAALEILLEYLEQHPETGIVGPQLLYADGRWQRSGGRMLSPGTAIADVLGFTSLGHIAAPLMKCGGRVQEIGYVDGACMLIRRAVIDQIGGLDERFFFFVEDTEFCYRARQHGWRVRYIPQSRVVHLRGGSSSQKDFQKSASMQLMSRKLFIERVYGNHGWKKTTFWSAVNYWIRHRLCRVLAKNHSKCEKYQFLNEIYWKEYIDSKTV